MNKKSQRIYEFDGFRLDVNERVLSRNGETIALYSKAFEMLVVLVEKRGRLLTKDELFATVWSEQIVEESNLTVNMSAIRKALGEQAREPRFVQTISGQGYRFIANVREIAIDDNDFVVESETFSRVTIERVDEIGGGKREIWEEPNSVDAERLLSDSRQPRRVIGGRNIAISVTALVLFVAGGYFLQRAYYLKRPGSQVGSIRRLTENGKVGSAALSPDGKLFAYSMSEGEGRSLWIGHTDGGEQLQIRPPANIIYLGLKFAPDGNGLFYVSSENYRRGALFRIPVFGGAPEKIHDDIRRGVTFSPDGKRFAYLRVDEVAARMSLVVADLQNANDQVILEEPNVFAFAESTPAWSPDGKMIAIGAAISRDVKGVDVLTVDLQDGAVKPLTARSWNEISGLAWKPDGSGLVATVREKTFSSSQVWQVSYPGGDAHRLLTDLSSYGGSLSMPTDGSTLLAVQVQLQSNVWVSRDDDVSAAKQVTFGSFGQDNGWNGLAWTPDGRIAYSRPSEKGLSIWIMNSDGGNQKQLIANGGDSLYPSITSDGRYIIFESNRGGNAAIWRADISGDNLVQLTEGREASQPAVSPDGKWIVYVASRDNLGELWRVTASGGEPKQLTNKLFNWVGISPNSMLIAAGFEENGQPKVAIISIDGGEPIQTIDAPRLANFRLGIHWTPDGRAITFRDWANGIWRQDLTAASPTRIEGLPTEKLYGYGWSPDGSRFAFVRGAEISDVVLISNEK